MGFQRKVFKEQGLSLGLLIFGKIRGEKVFKILKGWIDLHIF
jgi:hypothetical protein